MLMGSFQANDESPPEPALGRERLFYIPFSLLLIGFGFALIIGVCKDLERSAATPLLIFTAYLCSVATLLITIARRLYRKHQLRSFTFDIGTLALLTALASLPLGTANALWNVIDSVERRKIANDDTWVVLALATWHAFLIFPMFFVTEGAMALLSWMMRQKKEAS